MTTVADDSTASNLRFKRRKTTHTKRPRTDDASSAPGEQSHDPTTTHNAPEVPQDEEESVPNLKEILRNRKRPRNRLKDATRKPEPSQMELVQVEGPRTGQYTSRFVAQTGQVVDSSDKQMTAYVEARMAEQNYRQYGWPIPQHLQSTVAAIAPDLQYTFSNPNQATATPSAIDANDDNAEHRHRVAAGQGRLEEVDLGRDATRTHKDWQASHGDAPAPKQRLGRDGKPYRGRQRRTSDDLRRDQMVEAVLREAKLDFFDEPPPNPRFAGTDDDMLERFRSEYFESIEERQSRKPAQPPGAKDAPKGPKLGGSRSARAAMREREEAAAKANKR